MGEHGYSDLEIAQVVKIINKEDIKRDPESQALENVVGAVFELTPGESSVGIGIQVKQRIQVAQGL